MSYLSNTPGSGEGNAFDSHRPTTRPGIPVVNVGGDTIQEFLEGYFFPYASPAFATFLIFGQALVLEVGDTISGVQQFRWSFTNSANVSPNTMDIIDVTGGNIYLETDISTTSPFSTDVGVVQLTAPGTYSWKGGATNTNSIDFFSSLFTVNWEWRLFFGTSASLTLNESGIEGLTGSSLETSFVGTYNMAAGNYKYWAWPDSFGSPAPVVGFKDAATNLNIAMASAVDNAFYSNVQNGWSYGLVSVTNTFGVTTNYRLYRSKFQLGATLQAIIS